MFDNVRKFIGGETKEMTTGIFKGWGQDVQNSLKQDDLEWDKSHFLKANEISLYLNRAIEKRAEAVGSAQWVLIRDSDGEEVEEHEALDFINRPNKFHNGDKFWSLYQKYYDLTGTAFIFKEQEREIFKGFKNNALHLLRPDLMKVEINDAGTDIVGFKFNKPTGGSINYTPEQVVYSFRPNPLAPLNGVSLVQAGVRAVDTDIQISQYHSRILKNGGSVDLLFKIKDVANLDQEKIDQLKRQFKEKHAGATNAKEPMFFGNDVDIERIGLTPQELDYLETKKMTLNDISILTGVPRAILSNFDDIKFNNASVSYTTFKRDTVKPMLEDLREILNQNFRPDGYTYDFKEVVPEDAEEKRKNIETAHNVNALTINEKREELGYDPVDNGDKILVPINVLPLQESGENETRQRTVKKKHPLKGNPEARKAYGKLKVKVMDSEADRFEWHVKRFFTEQRERVLDKLEEGAQVGEVFDVQEERDIAKDRFQPLILEALKAGGEAANSVTRSFGKQKFELGQAATAWVASRSLQMARDVNETTKGQLDEVLKEGIAAGATRQDMVKNITALFDGFSDSRANTIARTETHGAIEFGTIENYKQEGIEEKIWVVTFDNSRDAHIDADGQERPIDQPFEVGGERLDFPGDFSGSPGNVVNCNCTI